MTRFFFNFRGGDDEAVDDIGCEFETLDLAYLDAYRSMVRIGADLLLEQKDPSRQWIEIVGEDGTVLMTLPFDEVFQRRRTAPHSARVKRQLERSRRVTRDVHAVCQEARVVVASARAMLSRAATSDLRPGLGW